MTGSHRRGICIGFGIWIGVSQILLHIVSGIPNGYDSFYSTQTLKRPREGSFYISSPLLSPGEDIGLDRDDDDSIECNCGGLCAVLVDMTYK